MTAAVFIFVTISHVLVLVIPLSEKIGKPGKSSSESSIDFSVCYDGSCLDSHAKTCSQSSCISGKRAGELHSGQNFAFDTAIDRCYEGFAEQRK